MKTILTLLMITVFSVQPAHSNDPKPKTVKIVITGAVYESGSRVVPNGTPLETILNEAGCHGGSSLNKITIYRAIDGKLTQLIVGQRNDGEIEEPVFLVRENDLIVVTQRMFDHTASERPMHVTGPFVLKNEQKPQPDK